MITGKDVIMFPFLATFIIFCLLLTYYIRKNDAAQQKVQDDFWEKERQANTVRKKDISKLDYITIPFEKIPVKLETSTENEFFQLAEKPMLNLTGISNTDLKLEYGTANLAALSEYDLNFTNFVTILPDYTSELLEAGEVDTAQMLLEFAVSVKADSRKIYKQLSEIYTQNNQLDKIQWLKDFAEVLPEYTKNAILKDLSSIG